MAGDLFAPPTPDEDIENVKARLKYIEDKLAGLSPRNIAGINEVQLRRVSNRAVYGNGSDGELNITSGTTTINLGAADVVTKNYTQINITGTGSLAFSNPGPNGTIVNLLSQSDVVITSSATPAVDLSGMGAAGGNIGSDGSYGNSTVVVTNQGKATTGSGSGSGGVASVAVNFNLAMVGKLLRVACGAGGGGGQNGTAATAAGGVGGRGGGALIVMCGGALNFAGNIKTSGANGTAASSADAGHAGTGGSGGGGGAAGTALLVYNTLLANTGTFTVAGGNGGAGGNGFNDNANTQPAPGGGSGGANRYAGGAGGDGGGNKQDGVIGIAGGGSSGGSPGAGGTFAHGLVGESGGGGGGGGASGDGYVIVNSEFS